jgi:hypothetical protein
MPESGPISGDLLTIAAAATAFTVMLNLNCSCALLARFWKTSEVLVEMSLLRASCRPISIAVPLGG